MTAAGLDDSSRRYNQGQLRLEQRGAAYAVAVVGAGVAGLSAARILSQHLPYNSVVVLEAAHNIGGRIHSTNIELDNGVSVTVECGAEFGHGLANSRLKDLLDGFGMKYEVRSWPDRIWTGKHLWNAERAEEEIPDIAAAYAFFSSLAGFEPMVDCTLEDIVRLLGARPLVSGIMNSVYANDFGCDMKSLGLQEACAEARAWNHGEEYFICRRPLSELTAHLSRNLNIKTSFAVKSVATLSPKTKKQHPLNRLTSSDGAIIDAQAVIIAIPLRQLQHDAIQFTPPLPECKIRSIGRIQVGDAMKVFLVFEGRPWPADVWDVVCPDADAFIPEFWMTSALRDDDTRSSENIHSITGFIAGKYAASLSELDETRILKQALDQIVDVFGPVARKCYRGGRVFHWGSKPFQQAGYSHPSLNALGARRILADALLHQGIFFAGEATHEGVNPCLQAAIETGERAARAMLSDLRLVDNRSQLQPKL